MEVTGVDPTDQAVAAPQNQARRRRVKLTTCVLRDDQFDFGTEQWDLVVLSYVGVKPVVARMYKAPCPMSLRRLGTLSPWIL